TRSSLLFYLQSSVDHRHLHSFPTRRSSDLCPARARHRGPGQACGPSPRQDRPPRLGALRPARLERRRLDDRSRKTAQRTRRRGRSEEHTSELQSLAYLVCRLLLEKKKKKTN